MVATVERVARPSSQVQGVYLALSLLMVAIVAFGFWPSYFALLFGGGVEKELFIHIHAVVYVSWLALFVVQAGLVATRRVALHRRLGQFGMFWGAVVLVVGVITTILAFSRMAHAGQLEEARQFVIWPALDMVIFAGFFIPAFCIAANRRFTSASWSSP